MPRGGGKPTWRSEPEIIANNGSTTGQRRIVVTDRNSPMITPMPSTGENSRSEKPPKQSVPHRLPARSHA